MSERVIARFRPDRSVYIRAHLIMAFVGIVGVAIILHLAGNAHVWVSLVAVPIAIAIRAVYLAPEELSATWELTERCLTGPSGNPVLLRDINLVRTLGSAAQVVTHAGDKHLMKYLTDPKRTATEIQRVLPS
jgi:hypothetical protein